MKPIFHSQEQSLSDAERFLSSSSSASINMSHKTHPPDAILHFPLHLLHRLLLHAFRSFNSRAVSSTLLYLNHLFILATLSESFLYQLHRWPPSWEGSVGRSNTLKRSHVEMLRTMSRFMEMKIAHPLYAKSLLRPTKMWHRCGRSGRSKLMPCSFPFQAIIILTE